MNGILGAAFVQMKWIQVFSSPKVFIKWITKLQNKNSYDRTSLMSPRLSVQ